MPLLAWPSQHPRAMRRLCAALILLSSCNGEDDPIPVVADATISRIESCDELESHLEDLAVEVLEAEIEARRENGFVTPPLVTADAMAPKLVGDGPFERMVADRDRVLMLDDGVLRSVGADPLREIATVAIEGAPIGVLPAGDRVFVLANVGGLTRVTLADRESLQIIGTMDLAGAPRSAFVDQNGLTLVLTGGLVPPPDATEDIALVKEESFRRIREGDIRDRTLDDWLVGDDLGRDCTAYHYVANAPVNLGLARIVAIDSDLRASAKFLIADTELNVARETVLLAAPHRWGKLRPGQVDHSYLFAFDQSGFIASGGIDGVPLQVSIGEAIDMITAVDSRVSDPINTWGRTIRAHRIDVLELSEGRLVTRASSPLFADDQPLRASRLLDDRAVATTDDKIYAFDLDDLGSFAAFPLSAPIDRLAETRGLLIATSVRSDKLEISVLDTASLGRALATRFVTNLLPGTQLGFSVDPSGMIAVPEIGSPAPDFPQTPSVAVRVLAVGESGSFSSSSTIELSLLHAQTPEAPHLLYGMFVGGRALAISDAGAGVLDSANLNMQSLLFK